MPELEWIQHLTMEHQLNIVKMEKIDIDKVELNVHDWIEMRQGALELLKNSMAQAIVYK
ncbi:hypothetical protein LCGC14_2185010, partial [marine sediment metagenome]